MVSPLQHLPVAVPRVAFVHPGDDSNGVNRYARIVADGVVQAGGRAEVLVPRRPGSLASLALTALKARRSDVVHLQLTKQYWGVGRHQFWASVVLRILLVGRPLVVTAHDFHTPRPADPRSARRPWSRLRIAADDAAAKLLLGSASLVLACSKEEADLLAWTRPRRTAVVPHFVEERPGVFRLHRADTGNSGPLVVLGYIHGRKGQLKAVETLPLLPEHHLVLAGTANERNQRYLQKIEDAARRLGVADRLRITGYLAEDDLEQVLASARAALAPYERIAASGSLSTLAAAAVPIVARRHASLADMADACPHGVNLYDEDTPEAIARAVSAIVAAPLDVQRAELLAWAARFTPRQTGEQHVNHYREVIRPRWRRSVGRAT